MLVIKVIRLMRGLKNFDLGLLLTYAKKSQQRSLEILIKNDHLKANNKDVDQTNIGTILIISYLLKIFKILLIICSLSYFFAMTFKICINIQNDYYNWDNYSDGKPQPEHFTMFYGLENLE